MKLKLAYGKTGYSLETGIHPHVELRPTYPEPLEDELAGFNEAISMPLGGVAPLADRIHPGEKLVIVLPDITRALPSERLLKWLFMALPQVDDKDIVILSGTGTHRTNSPDEWIQMVGKDIYQRYRCVDHVCDDEANLVEVGKSRFGYAVSFNREYVEADRRILMGFIEPHFMAGFSGGYKAVFPGVTGIDAIMRYHSAANIAHPNSTWGVIKHNPTQDNIRAGGSLVPIDFCINVTLDDRQNITRYFCGDVLAAHDAGCAFCKQTAMIRCERAFPVVVTSNSGYPLDQNLYQCVKGMSAAAQIVEDGGLIILAGACNDGFPEHGNFRRMLREHDSPDSMLETILSPGFHCRDQWQVQILANILKKAKVAVYSGMTRDQIRQAHMLPVEDLNAYLGDVLRTLPADTPLAILPEGPMTIPYLA